MKILGRDLRLDACRGVALWFIFLDHVPDNIGSWFTLQHYGFSDTTEVFMFISGVTCALAYGKALQRQGVGGMIARTLHRSWDIYVAFLVLMLACAVLAFAAGGTFMDASNTRILLEHPGPTLTHALILQYRPVNSDVLPTFVLFHALVGPLLLALRRAPNLTLAASMLLYLATRWFGWNLPQWPRNDWFFNPFAWQVLFVFGAWWGSGGGKKLWPLIRAHVPVLSICYLLFGLVVVLGWTIKPLGDLIPEFLVKAIYPIDKSGLDPLRLLHFLALAVLVAHFVPRDWLGFGRRTRDQKPGATALTDQGAARGSALHRYLVTPVMRGAIRCGENSLGIYCLSVLLSLAGHLVLTQVSRGLPMQTAVSLAGIALMIATATALAWIMRESREQPGLF